MMTIRCPLCESRDFRPFFEDWGYDKKQYKIVTCGHCGFCFVNPQPTDEELNKIYGQYYGSEGELEKTEDHLKFRVPVFEDLCERIESFRTGEAKLLDVGCGNGDFLHLARSRGWNVSGVEVSEPAVRFAREKRNLDVIGGNFEELPYPDQSFNVVTILDVLEHVRNPLKTLQSIYRVIKPGGVLIIRVPNTPFQIFKARIQRLKHGQKFTTMATPLHLNHFDSKQIEFAVGRVGFTGIKIFPGTADGVGRSLKLKKAYVEFSSLIAMVASIHIENILCVQATKK